jgi:dethiobiotin synthetase/adenosylmethionine--8-amino-7-oxononanoate aminotransferase
LFGGSRSILEGRQHTWRGLPVIFDEVFTGLYRLGRFSAASFLGVHPDISVHAKLLTGGLVPLAVTLASEDIYHTFKGDEKAGMLLQGSSYTAHPVGCHVATVNVREMGKIESRGEWEWAKRGNGWNSVINESVNVDYMEPIVWSVWNAGFVVWLSMQSSKPCMQVYSAWALGSVLVIHLKLDPVNTRPRHDYGAATKLDAALLDTVVGADAGTRWNVHTRAIGDTLYLLASQKTCMEDIKQMEQRLREVLAE